MSTIYLIRHGQASFGSDHYDRLSATGQRQAELLTRHFAAIELVFDAVYCGSLERQIDTAEPIYRNGNTGQGNVPEPVTSELFNEYNSRAVWEHYLPIVCRHKPSLAKDVKNVTTDRKAFQRLFGEVMTAWISNSETEDGPESWNDFGKQVISGIHKIIQEQGRKKKVALFTSGGPIAVVVQQALNLTDVATLRLSWQIMNASVTRIQYNGERIALQVFNDITHLELMKDQTLLTYR